MSNNFCLMTENGRRCEPHLPTTTSTVSEVGAMPFSESGRTPAHAAPSALWRHTGMPSFLALSARLAEMPEPGKATRPAGNASSI